MFSLKDYDPPKPFWAMNIQELVKYNKRCQKIVNIFFKTKRKKT